MKNELHLVNRWRIAFLVVCTIGACLSADLIRLHVRVHTDPEYHSYCAISERVNCETVAASNYAVFLGLPVALWGLLAYFSMGALAIWGLRRPLSPSSWPFGLLFWSNLLSCIVSIYLFSISHFVIESLCVVCTGTYLVNIALMLLVVIELRHLKTGPIKALKDELKSFSVRKSSLVTMALVMAVAIVILYFTIPSYWHIEETKGPGGFPIGITKDGHAWIGAQKPKVIIDEFSDYQCPHCRRGHDEMRKLIETYPAQIRLVHHHFPLDSACNQDISGVFHPYACLYAQMAYCAQKQARFWEANDFLFANGRRREPVTYTELASAVQIDAQLLELCIKSNDAWNAIQHDLAAGRSLNVRGTPTFVLDGTIYPGRIPPEVLTAALQ